LATQTGSYDFLAAKAAHDNLQEQIDPIATKTYTGIIGTANTAVDASFYFAKVHPDDYNGVWQVKLRINVTAPVIYQEIVDVTVSGRASAYMAYDAVSHRSNSALAICYLNLYKAKQAGITAGKGHALGFGLRGSTNPANATYARTITVEVLDQVNCTVQLLDSAVKYANMDGTGTTNYDALIELYIGAYGQNASNNANTYDRVLYNSNVKAAANLTAARIVCGNSAGYKNIGAGTVFDITYPLLYNNTAYNSGAVRADLDLVRINIAFSNNGTIESAAQHSMVYLKGTIIGNAFTIAASPFMTCKVPTSADGYCYLPLGRLRDSTTNGQFTSSHELWCYKDGAFGPVSLREASQAAKTATNYITKQGSGDTWIHAEGMGPDSSNNPTSTTRGWRIGDALDLFRGTVSMFKAWVDGTVAKVRVGVESAGHAIFTPNGMQVYKAGNLKADYADTITLYGGNAAAGANPKITIGESVSNVASLAMYDSGGQRRILMNSSVGLLIGRSDKQHIVINDSDVNIYNNASTPTLSAKLNVDGLTMYREGKKRAATTANGLDIFADFIGSNDTYQSRVTSLNSGGLDLFTGAFIQSASPPTEVQTFHIGNDGMRLYAGEGKQYLAIEGEISGIASIIADKYSTGITTQVDPQLTLAVGQNEENYIRLVGKASGKHIEFGTDKTTIDSPTTITGSLTLSKTQDLSGTANNSPALIVGGTATQAHIEIGNNKIQAKASGTTTAALYLNSDGGGVYVNNVSVRDASSINAGTFAVARIPTLTMSKISDAGTLAKKSSVSLVHDNQTATSDEINLNAGAGTSITFTLKQPSGYEFAGIYNVTTNHNQACTIGRFGYSSTDNLATVMVTNRSSTNFTKTNKNALTASMGVHFVKVSVS